jgi:hypothetical protein
MSVFGENTIGSRVSLDVTGSYPTGLMAALGSYYNDPQLLTMAQLRYTAAQVDINAQQDAAYARTNLQVEREATVAANNLATQMAATNYKNASEGVNYANQNTSTLANTAYTNAFSVYKICADASYLAYLTHKATEIVAERVESETIVKSVGVSKPDVNTIDTTTLSKVSTMVSNTVQDARNATVLAQNNALQYLLRTQELLNNAIIRSTSVSLNLTIVSKFDILVKLVIKNMADPLNLIAGKETLVTQYVPSVPLNNAIQVANYAINMIKGFIYASSLNLTTNVDITTNIAASIALSNSLDTIARGNDSVLYLAEATAKQMIQAASTMKSLGSEISIPGDRPYDQYYVSRESINIANAARKISAPADVSASNSRVVSDALISLQTSFACNITPEPMVIASANNSLKMLNEMMAAVNRVTSNTSAHTGVAVSIRSSNTVNGLLSQITVKEIDSNVAANDALSVLEILIKARTQATVPDVDVALALLWRVNEAKGRAEEVSEKAKQTSLILSRTAHNSVTPQTIAIQTASANNAGRINNNNLSKLDRNSRNVPVDPPAAYKSFNAGIRVKAFQPVRPTLDELVLKNRLAPLRLDSLRTVTATKIKVAQDVQHINDISAFSFRQQ